MIKINKQVRIRRRIGQPLQVVREQYMRDVVPCMSPLCLSDCNNEVKKKIFLPEKAIHYVVPDCEVALKYMEVLESPELKGFIFMQTVAESVLYRGSRKLHKQMHSIIKDPRKQSILFLNEFQRYAFTNRIPGETRESWQARSIYNAAVWFYNHLTEQIQIVIITTNEKYCEEYGLKTAGVYVVSLAYYLSNFWPDLPEVLQLYESLTLVSPTDNDSCYQGYLAEDVLNAGITQGLYVKGILQVNKFNAMNEAFVRLSGSGSKGLQQDDDVMVYSLTDRNRAIHGDLVVVQLYPKTQWQTRSNRITNSEEANKEAQDNRTSSDTTMPTGKVVGVLQHNWRDYVATFMPNQDSYNKGNYVLVVPYDWRIPRIRICTKQKERFLNHRVVVRLDNWPSGYQYPNGHFVRSLGEAGQLETEVAALLVENELSAPPFTDSQLKEMPSCDWSASLDTDTVNRLDLRDTHLIFSIDPQGCEDVDDALSVRLLPNGHLELGVHIADVTHFVKPQSFTDIEARNRSTTVYLADRRYDMLPGVLSANICSLVSNIDRYAMSVIWEMKDYEVQKVWYGKTVIRSRYKLFYEIAQSIADGAPVDELVKAIPELQALDNKSLDTTVEELCWAVQTLMQIARELKSKRTTLGALELEGSEVRVEMTQSKHVQNLIPKQTLEIHDTIAECMIFANHWVAKRILQAFPTHALLRRHPPPRHAYFYLLERCAAAKGFIIKSRTNKELASSLDESVDQEDPFVNKILRMLATHAMSNAEYFSTGALSRDLFNHYGLALDLYTHFTSPIRRYADIIVHRLLMAAITNCPADRLWQTSDLQELCGHINKKHRAAQNAQRDSQELFQTLFFKDKDAHDERCIVDGVVFELRANGMIVYIPRYSIKSALYLINKEGQVLYACEEGEQWLPGAVELRKDTITSISARGIQSYKLFDHITVRICIQENTYHSCSLFLQLVKKSPFQHDLILEQKEQRKAIIKVAKDQSKIRNETSSLDDDGMDFEDKKLYGQSDSNFYQILQSLSEMAITSHSSST